MARLTLLLLALWAVKVSALLRPKRAGEPGAVTNVTGAMTNVTGVVTNATSAASALVAVTARARAHRRALARRAYEEKPEPPKQKRGSGRDTSSSSGARKKTDDSASDQDSLKITDSSASSTASDAETNKKYVPKSTEERHGWRKWHRKCTRCPADQRKKWRDPGIKWVCGAYQRARRSFKSLCMMRLRNCQDGTMFVPIHEHRCANSSLADSRPHGDHFMYDYRAALSEDTSDSKESSKETSESASNSAT